jgi:hypothetical protein
MDEIDEAIEARLDAAVATVSGTRAGELEGAIGAAEMRQRRRHLLAIAAAIVVLVAIVGGGLALARRAPTDPDRQVASGTPADVAKYLAQSSDKSLNANTFTFAVRSSFSATGPDLTKYLACMQGTQPGAASKISVDLARNIAESLDPATGAPIVVSAPGFDAISASQFAGTTIAQPWVSYDRFDPQMMMGTSGLNPGLGVRMAAPGSAYQIDPEGLLSYLRNGARSVRDAGREDIDGVATDHLVIELDPAKSSDEPKSRAATDQEIARQRGHKPAVTTPSSSSSSSVPSNPIDVWIGRDDGLIRRLHLNENLTDPSGVAGTIDLTIDYSGYGQPLPVEPPTLEQTVPFGSLPASALLDDAAQTNTCTALAGAAGADSPLPPPSVLECIQQAKQRSLAGKTVADYLREPREGLLPDDDGPVIQGPGDSDEMRCYRGLGPATTNPGTPLPPCPTFPDPKDPNATIVTPSVNGPCLRPT